VTTQITNWIVAHGLLAVFVLMAVDAVLPAGGELVMVLGGALAAGALGGHQHPSLVAVVLVGALGYLAGSLIGWAIGRAGGRPLIERRGRWLHLGPERFARAERWFDRFGGAFVLLGRFVPLLRSFVSIPAGVLEYPLGPYVALSSVASLVWCLGFGIAGHALGSRWDSVHHAFGYVEIAAVAALVIVAAILFFRATTTRTRSAR
jgi:membrane protein DedA with SNARE-associated domain